MKHSFPAPRLPARLPAAHSAKEVSRFYQPAGKMNSHKAPALLYAFRAKARRACAAAFEKNF
jgi:hypothetical protein